MTDSRTKDLSMAKPAVYRLRVRGRVNPRWIASFSDFDCSEEACDGAEPDTVLVGRIPDQAALSGVLNSLYELHLPLVSAECLDAGEAEGSRPQEQT